MTAAGSRVAAAVLACVFAPIVSAGQPVQNHLSAGDVVLLANTTDAHATAAVRTTEILSHGVTTRTPPPLAASVLPSTLSAAGCVPHRGTVANALVTYAPTGRPARADVNVNGLSEGCRNALTAIASVSFEENNSGAKPQTLIVPVTPEFASCLASEPAAVANSLSAGIQDPKLKKEVKPNYFTLK